MRSLNPWMRSRADHAVSQINLSILLSFLLGKLVKALVATACRSTGAPLITVRSGAMETATRAAPPVLRQLLCPPQSNREMLLEPWTDLFPCMKRHQKQ